MKKVIGALLIASPVIAVVVTFAIERGIKVTLIMLGVTIGMLGLMALGAWVYRD